MSIWSYLDVADAEARKAGVDPALVADLLLDTLKTAEQTYKPETGTFKTHVRLLVRRVVCKFRDTSVKTLPNYYEGDGIADSLAEWGFFERAKGFDNHSVRLEQEILDDHTSTRGVDPRTICKSGSRQKEELPVDITDRFSALDSEELELLHRYYVEGVTLRQLSNELGISFQGVHQRIKRIVDKCK